MAAVFLGAVGSVEAGMATMERAVAAVAAVVQRPGLQVEREAEVAMAAAGVVLEDKVEAERAAVEEAAARAMDQSMRKPGYWR